ncbi:ABC transporter permease [Amycolatopsis cihanbeyliensis]|uniref:ABC-2 family transporter n=1 Tax=Amycolatopsis cihanbeyliensis TaxID=1128664 RepID=A0A542DBS5_AMYCI|nr:ABC transporter permease [Amycolatopsis cihanbeyliensis]TQJ00517.1 hypothetical protein FB471_0143 [Amycolatopsis cihanbeyliensis]
MAAPAPVPTPAPAPHVPGVSLARVSTSEWIKLRSVRSTTIGLPLAMVVLVGVGLIMSSSMGETFAAGTEPDGAPFIPTSPAEATLNGAVFAQLLVGAIGVLYVSVEYSTGMIRATSSAVPTRLPMLWAKCLVYGGVVFGLTLLATLVAFFAGSVPLSAHGVAPSLGDPGVLRAVLATPTYLAAVGVLAISVAVLMRSTVLAFSTIAFVMFLLDSLAPLLLPGSVADVVVPYLPSTAGRASMSVAFMSVPNDRELLEPLTGFAVLGGYVLVILASAAVVLRRRDV